jgi:hypothetical protein
MHQDISYTGDNSPRRALIDWCQWLGFKRAHQLARLAAGKTCFGEPPAIDLKERWNTFKPQDQLLA